MKIALTDILLYIVVLIVLYSCESFKSDVAKKLIAGTYFRFSEHEFGKEWDTIDIREKVEDEAGKVQSATAFKITRRWRYERILEGKKIEPEYKRTVSTASYANEELKESETGLVFSFDFKRRFLFIGDTKYEKL
jgi:hypothetical protein